MIRLLVRHLGFLFAVAMFLHLAFAPAGSVLQCVEVAFFVSVWMMPLTIFTHAFAWPPNRESTRPGVFIRWGRNS
jgi:hypothetical protein